VDPSLLPWSTVGPWGLVAMFFGFVFLGLLQPKPLVDRDIRLLEKIADKLEKEALSWRTAYELSEAARTEQSRQFTVLLESDKLTQELVRALHGELS
jgi:hypothetical protein